MLFIGANDRATLEGVVEEIDRLITQEARTRNSGRLKRDRHAADHALGVLTGLKGTIEMAIPNGPTRNFEAVLELGRRNAAAVRGDVPSPEAPPR